MEVIITPSAKKTIKKLSKISQIAVIEKLKKLESETASGITKLSGYKDAFRIRIGDYRIVYKTSRNKAYIVLVGHRKEVYKLLKNLLK